MTTSIFVTFDHIAFHSWPGASDNREYLAHRHRHKFGFRVECDVEHDDREIEFHNLLDECAAWVKGFMGDEWGATSCETAARALGATLVGRYKRPFVVTVDEDGECGARVSVGSMLEKGIG
jgi:hypothetical protein